MAEMPDAPGWYRLGDHGWQPVDDTQAETELAAGQGWDLVHVGTAQPAAEEIPLF